MAHSDTKKFLGRTWALNGNRQDPSDFSLDISEGWTPHYEQPGSGFEPERTLFNQFFCQIEQAFTEGIQRGIPEWDARVNYQADETGHSFVTASDGQIYVSARASGPAFGNATDPTMDNDKTVWQEY